MPQKEFRLPGTFITHLKNGGFFYFTALNHNEDQYLDGRNQAVFNFQTQHNIVVKIVS